MKYFSVFAVPTLAALVSAQSAPDFPVQVNTNLRVDFLNSSTSVSPAGILLPRDDVLYGPTVYGPENATQEATYMLFMVDEDVNTGNGPRVQLLHYFQPNLAGINHALSVEAHAQNATTAVGAEYLTPSPPAGDGPHRYTLLLYPQPEGFTVPQAYISFSPPADTNARYPFNMSGFAEAAGLGQPIAANWFRVVNDTTSTTSSTSSSASTATGTAITTSVRTSTVASTSASPSVSASASAAANSAAARDEVRGSARELVAGLAMGIAGAWLWML